MKKISTVLAIAALTILAACGTAPTAAGTADAGAPQLNTGETGDTPSNTTQSDTTNGRVPNMMGSGN